MARQILDLDPISVVDDDYWIPVDNGTESKRVNVTALGSQLALGVVPLYNVLATGSFRINVSGGTLKFEQYNGTIWVELTDFGSIV